MGMSLSMARPSAASAAAALLDALSRDYRPRSHAPNERRIVVGSGDDWSLLKEALAGTNLPLYFMPARPRSARELVGLLGHRPGGLKLKPDLTNRPEEERVAQVPQGGSPLDFEHADAIVRGRFKGMFSAHREALLSSEEEVSSLAKRLQDLIAAFKAAHSVAPPTK